MPLSSKPDIMAPFLTVGLTLLPKVAPPPPPQYPGGWGRFYTETPPTGGSSPTRPHSRFTRRV